jgi:hypothetical protein
VIKEILETMLGKVLSKEEFEQLMKMTDQDIKFNFISFGKKTHLTDVLTVATRCYKASHV